MAEDKIYNNIDKRADWQKQHESRENERALIRSRHNAIREYSGVVYRHPKPTPTLMDDEKMDVAVYTRVSTMSLNQTSSIENQELYYTDKVNKKENWNLTEIYSDEGKSGTSTKKRDAFNKMMQDAREGKFNLILCASVSRFARNISDCLEYITELRLMHPEKPIGVYFETENIYTLNKDADQTLSFHALLADWESGNKSRRMILSYDQRIMTNQFPVNDLLGYRHTKDGNLEIVPEEAQTVRFIYLSYITGSSAEKIAEVLTERKRPTLTGRTDWNSSMVMGIMGNERRWGDLEARKTVVLDYKKKKIVKNVDIREGAFVPNHHEAIVSRDMAMMARTISQSPSLQDGLPDTFVIANGALKGFVCIFPSWYGITEDRLQVACRSVYTDEELDNLEHEAKIRSGEEHARMVSMSLHGYQVPHSAFFINRSNPSMTFTKAGIKFSSSCLKRLGDCEFVEILYHPMLQTVAVRPCSQDNPNAVKWRSKGEMAAKGFASSIYQIMNWRRDFQFRFRGIQRTRNGASILLFDLSEPQILVGKGYARSSDQTQYIPYLEEKDGDTLEFKPDRAFVAYPAELAGKSVGISYALKKRIRQIGDDITENDINETGTIVSNSMFGDIPEKWQMVDELERLLAIM